MYDNRGAEVLVSLKKDTKNQARKSAREYYIIQEDVRVTHMCCKGVTRLYF